MHTYWLLSVIERAKSTDPEKIIAVWENDSYRMMNGKVLKMRACDHKVIQDLTVSEFVGPEQQKVSMNIPPYYWYKGNILLRSGVHHSGGKGAALDGSAVGPLQGKK